MQSLDFEIAKRCLVLKSTDWRRKSDLTPDACEKNLLREWNAFVLLAEVNEAQRGTDTLTQRPVW